MDKTKQPGISFDGIILINEEFRRDNIVEDDTNINIEFDAINSYDGSSGTVELTTIVNLIDDKKIVMELKSTFVGLFSVIEKEENMGIKEFIENNAPALMLPYIREHISSITTKAGIKPILLQPINLIALLENKD